MKTSILTSFGVRTNLGRRIILTFSLLIGLLTILTGGLLAGSTFTALQTQVELYQKQTAERASEQIGFYLQRLRDNLTLLGLFGGTDLAQINQVAQSLFDEEAAFLEIVVVDLNGNVVGGVARQEVVLRNLFTVRQSEWYTQATAGNNYLGSLQISSTNQPYAIMALPVRLNNQTVGVLAARIDMRAVWDQVAQIKIGQTGQVYIVNKDGILIAHPNPALVMQGMNLSEDPEMTTILQSKPGQVQTFTGLNGEPSLGSTVLIPGTDFLLITETPVREATAVIRQTVWLFLGLLLAAIMVGVATSRQLARQILRPLQELAATAERVGGGDLAARAEVITADEIGLLATTFNRVLDQLNQTLTNLENRVRERTRALEASLEVSRRLSTFLDQRQLVGAVVEELEKAFNYYHVHIYLFDERQENLVMVSGSGEAGRLLLERGHKIPRDKGLVGRSASTASVVLVPDTSTNPDWLPNPLLPETRSEIAVPIMVGETVFGVLDVQQNVIGGLTEVDADLLQSIALQLAIALQNARAYARAQHQAELEALVTTISERIRSTTTIEETLKVAVREAGRLVGGKKAWIKLYRHPFSSQSTLTREEK